MRWSHFLAIAICIFSTISLNAQDKTGTDILDKLLAADDIKKASITLDSFITKFEKTQQFDSLAYYIYYVGNITQIQSTKKQGQTKAEAFFESIKNGTSNPATLRQACLSLASYYDIIGNQHLSFDITKQALLYTQQMPDATGRQYGAIHSNLGTIAMRNGTIDIGIAEYKKSLKKYNEDPESAAKDLYFGYSSMGTAMYFSSKMDSAVYYYQLAINTIKDSDSTPMNRYYRPALLYNNIAGISSMNGNNTDAIEAMKKNFELSRKFINSDAEKFKRDEAKQSYGVSIENYAGIYQKLGDYKKAHDLLQYAYEQKLKTTTEDSPEIFKSKVLLGQSSINLLNFEEAATYFDEAIDRIKKAQGNFYVWNANAHYGRAKVYEEVGNIEKATQFYNKSEALYANSQKESFEEGYLNNLKNLSIFYSKNKNPEKAIESASKAYNYILEHQENTSLPALKETLNMAQVYYNINDYNKSLYYSNITNKKIDSILVQEGTSQKNNALQLLKPQASLLKTKVLFATTPIKTKRFLDSLSKNIDKALDIIKSQKQKISSPESIALLNSENEALFDFSKKLKLLLYNETNETEHLNQLLKLHEENLYSKIRTRLNSIKALKFSEIPDAIVTREDSLKKRLDYFEDGIESYIKTQEVWEDFKFQLKKEYPKYYTLRSVSYTHLTLPTTPYV